jgi:hypothetical protein
MDIGKSKVQFYCSGKSEIVCRIWDRHQEERFYETERKFVW